jgi:hypothetical protein
MKRQEVSSVKPIFLGVDFLDLDVVAIKGETTYTQGNGFWYVCSRDGSWNRLEYADAGERAALYNEIKHRVRAFERTLK